ncbi:MAG: hypothetical protein LBV41_10040 [Cytophagaceae bacterium]|jgi:hypothetical protein|nr:hypothetical protein [Cytophagaceae bacterium]
MRNKRKTYNKPVIEVIKLDTATSLIMGSVTEEKPPGDPFGAPPLPAGTKSDNRKEHSDIENVNSFDGNPFK